MRKVMTLIVAAMVGWLVACGPAASLNPLFTDKDLTFDDGLLGQWTDDTPGFVLTFEKNGPNAYRLTNSEIGRNQLPTQTVYGAHLVSLGDHLFLDVVPDQWPAQRYQAQLGTVRADDHQGAADAPSLILIDDGFYAEIEGDTSAPSAGTTLSLMQGHWIFRVDRQGDSLVLSAFDQDWLAKAIEQGRIDSSLKVAKDNGNDLVLTADTADLQRFVIQYADDNEAFQPSSELHRTN